MGFCHFNNVVVAINGIKQKYANHPKCPQKVLIVDWDVHHGNGTQDLTYNDSNIFYFSVHRFGDNFYPGTGDVDETGGNNAVGTNMNVPLKKGMGNDEYKLVWKDILIPVAKEFKPDLIVVSAGFDACAGDEVGEMRLTPTYYGVLTKQLMEIQSKIVLVLEGGYNLVMISKCICCCIYTLLTVGKDQPIKDNQVSNQSQDRWNNEMQWMSEMWSYPEGFMQFLDESLPSTTSVPHWHGEWVEIFQENWGLVDGITTIIDRVLHEYSKIKNMHNKVRGIPKRSHRKSQKQLDKQVQGQKVALVGFVNSDGTSSLCRINIAGSGAARVDTETKENDRKSNDQLNAGGTSEDSAGDETESKSNDRLPAARGSYQVAFKSAPWSGAYQVAGGGADIETESKSNDRLPAARSKPGLSFYSRFDYVRRSDPERAEQMILDQLHQMQEIEQNLLQINFLKQQDVEKYQQIRNAKWNQMMDNKKKKNMGGAD